VLCTGLSDASHDLHYSQLYDSCLQVPGALSTNEFDIERRHFMSRLNDVAMRLLFHQVHTHSRKLGEILGWRGGEEGMTTMMIVDL